MPTKAKQQVSTPESVAIEQNEQNKLKLVAAEEKANRLSLAADEADIGMDGITDSWDQGDETASAADYSLAQIEFKRATALYEAAQRSAQAIAKSVVNTDTTLAAIVAPYVKATHPDYGDVGVSFLRPKEMPDPNRPAATVVQSQPVKSGRGGAMSGVVDIVLLRKSFHLGLNAKKIEDAALKDGISLSITARTDNPQGDHVVDTLHVIANSAHAAVPVIYINPSKAMASRFAQSLAGALCGATVSTTDSPMQMVQGGGYRSAVMSVEATNGVILHNDANADGKRLTEVEASLKWSASGVRKPQRPIEAYLRQTVADEAGIFAEGLGVVTEAKIESMEFPNPLGESSAVVHVTFASASR